MVRTVRSSWLPSALAVLVLGGCVASQSPAPQEDSAGGRQSLSPDVTPPINGGRPIAEITDTTTPQPPIEPLSVEEELRRFVLQPGYRLEPVLTEPTIKEPAQIAFDGNGRMFVLELRAYMQDADATDELAPTGRISWHEDTDDDGVYDRHGVFVDSLVFPRFVLPFGANSVLSMESNEDEVYRFTDTDGDGRADKKELFTTDFGRSGNVEHQQASLFVGMDNWMYSTYNAFRVRWTPDGVIREPTGANRSQWGITQDDEGKVWFQGGASGVPGTFQFPVHYGAFNVEDQFAEGFKEPWGLAGVGDYQPGPQASRPDGTLAEVTGSAGNDVFRGHRLPADLRGDYLYGEPVARIVRRVDPVVTEGLTQLHNVYQADSSEFIRSIDPLFRPVDLATAPDGTLYVVDMYRGIIQEGNWTPRGSHLRGKIDQYGMGSIVGRGRIWRVTYDGMERDRTRPRMLQETPAQLVRHLEHPNGWWRDMAQHLLVLAQDRSVAPALRAMARSPENRLARYHALWTLEGLGELDAALVREMLRDPDPRVRVQALRASESLYKAGDASLAQDYRVLAKDADTDVAIQAILTASVLKVPGAADLIREAMAANPARGVQMVGEQMLNPPSNNFAGFSAEQRVLMARGAAVYNELCAQCHGEAGRGTPVAGGQLMAPALAGSPRVLGHRDYAIKTLLHGLTGPIDGKTYAGGIMLAMGENPDEWIAGVVSFIRNSFANRAAFVSPEDVARVRAANAGRTTMWTYDELTASVPRPLQPQPSWKATASHSAPTRLGMTADPMGVFTFEGWTTGTAQKPGMWLQVELPSAVNLAEIQFESPFQSAGQGRPPLSTTPIEYRVEVSTDGAAWKPVATGGGTPGTTVIAFEPARARFIRITQTGTAESAPHWSMQQMRLFATPER